MTVLGPLALDEGCQVPHVFLILMPQEEVRGVSSDGVGLNHTIEISGAEIFPLSSLADLYFPSQ